MRFLGFGKKKQPTPGPYSVRVLQGQSSGGRNVWITNDDNRPICIVGSVSGRTTDSKKVHADAEFICAAMNSYAGVPA